MDTWNDQDEYESSALDARDLFERMQRDWTWPAPRGDAFDRMSDNHAAALGLPADPGARDLDGLTPLERASLEVGIADDNARRVRAEWVALLPHLTVTAHGVLCCTNCARADDLKVREIGFESWTAAFCDADDPGERGVLYVSSSGWDDYTEEGTAIWVYCIACDTSHQLPEHVEWV
jgi:hypothetical protein